MKAIIYKIQNITTLDCYIGSSANYSRRKKRHFEDLKKGNHHSIILQRAYNKYGVDLFEISILESFEYFTKKDILNREQYYLDFIKPIYNICKTAGSQLGSTRSLEFKELCRKRMKGKEPWNKGLKTGSQSKEAIFNRKQSLKGRIVTIETKNKIKSGVSKPIIQYDKNGVFIKEWESAKKASLELNFCYTALVKYLTGNSNITTFKNNIWKRK